MINVFHKKSLLKRTGFFLNNLGLFGHHFKVNRCSDVFI